MNRFIRLPELMKVTGYSRPSIYRLMADDAFPRQVHIGANASAWLSSDIEKWMASKIEAAHKQQA